MCTVLFMKTEAGFLLGKNNDNFFSEGILFTNRRGIIKSALIMPPCNPLQWKVKYGSLSFSQCGKELPVGGMNEAGLVVEQTTLPDTKYPEYRGGAGVGELQSIQYLLDTCVDVQEAIQSIENTEICQPTCPIHYVIADASGNMAVIEYIQRERKIFTGKNIAAKVVTNSRYDKANALYLQNNSDIRCENEYEYNSLQRFYKAADILNSTEYFDISSAFMYLEQLERIDTVWNIIYDPQNLNIYFRTKDSVEIKNVNLREIDFGEKSQPLLFPLSYPIEGNINCKFMKYSREKNSELINKFFKNELVASVMGITIPDELLEYLASYPELMEEANQYH